MATEARTGAVCAPPKELLPPDVVNAVGAVTHRAGRTTVALTWLSACAPKTVMV
jgi:hypothetical protein